MREIEQEVLDTIPDPITKMAWEKWIAEGTARLIPSATTDDWTERTERTEKTERTERTERTKNPPTEVRPCSPTDE